jgi:hypothetical protein
MDETGQTLIKTAMNQLQLSARAYGMNERPRLDYNGLRTEVCAEGILETRRQILVFGNSTMLGDMSAILGVSPLLNVVQRRADEAVASLGELHPDVILVDAAQVTPEPFRELIALCPAILRIAPLTYQLTVLSSPRHANPLAEMAPVTGILSFALPQPARADR